MCWMIVAGATLLISGLFFGFVLLLIVVALLEKQYVSQFEPASPRAEVEPSIYAQTMRAGLAAEGYREAGWFELHRGRTDLRVGLFLSPSGHALAQLAIGRIGGMKYEKVFLHTRLRGGRFIASTDQAGEGDISGTIHYRFLSDANFSDLAAFHDRRVRDACVAGDAEAEPFVPAGIQKQWEAIERARAEGMERQGYGRFIDPQRNTYRYTLGGAVRLVTRSFIPQFMEGVGQTRWD